MAQELNGLGKETAVGRDHHHDAFSVLAGGGVKAGHVHGRTDDLGKVPKEVLA